MPTTMLVAMEEKAKAVKKDEVKNAISCPGNHACRGNPESMCPVSSVISDDMVFVDNKKHRQCPYYLPFGYGGFCNLPVRKEIYNLYGV